MRNALKPLILAAVALAAIPAFAAEGWLTSYDAAAKESKRSGKPILADFTGSDWCGWCMKLDREVFATPEFKTWAKKNVVLLTLDYPQQKKMAPAEKKQNEMLAKKYSIRGFPTILFLKPNGAKLGEYGYDQGGPKVWTAKAAKMMKGKAA